MRGKSICGILLSALTAAGCSGIRTYPNELEKNAAIHLHRDPSTLLSQRTVDVDLYTVDGACHATYLGSMHLHESTTDLGLPPDRRVLLAYVFSHSALIGTSGTTVIEMMLTPQRGHRYEFEVSYLKKGYTATGLDFRPGQAQGTNIEHSRLRDCTAAPR